MPITQLFIDSQIAGHPLVGRFSAALNLQPIVIPDKSQIFEVIKNREDPWQAGKNILFLTRNRGAFIKECPGTRDYTCCGYQILHIASFCTMDCAYCILQSYFHPPVLQYFVNQDDLMHELDARLSENRMERFGTGEFTDSLIWEAWSDLTPQLVERFGRQKHAVLELKTKTTAIDLLKGLPHERKTILAWSLNTPRMIGTQERGTASLNARMRSAARCQSWGYPLAFHFDPLIIYPGCAQEYIDVLKMLFKHVSPENIVWISLGTLRFMPALQPVIQQRFPESNIVYGEFVSGLDGKMRYFKPLRIRLYRQFIDCIREIAPEVTVYFCMEDDQVWFRSFGFLPQDRGGLAAMLDHSAQTHCDLIRG
jgi:spore photoproduct lyase